MARKTWLRMLSEHPSSHLIVARPVETSVEEMARLLELLDRLIDRMQPRGAYATTLIKVKPSRRSTARSSTSGRRRA